MPNDKIGAVNSKPSDVQQIRTPTKIQDRAFQFSVRVAELHKVLAKSTETSRVIARQVLRSGTSIGANLEEAEAAQSRNDFVLKCSIALKEARETSYWLRLLVAAKLVEENKLAPLIQESNEIVAILTTIRKRARQNADKRMS